jgi:hypothetical protein
MRTQLILASLILCIIAPEARPQTTRPQAATTQAIDPRIEKLVHELGDDDPHVREAAAGTLKKLGKDALPALQVATHDPDPQVRVSAGDLIAAQKNPAHSAQSLVAVDSNEPNGLIFHNGQIHFGGNAQVRVRVQANGNAREVRNMLISENGNKISIHEDNNSIDMEVTPAHGDPKRYTAKNVAELKEKEPGAYKIYQRYVNGWAGKDD